MPSGLAQGAYQTVCLHSADGVVALVAHIQHPRCIEGQRRRLVKARGIALPIFVRWTMNSRPNIMITGDGRLSIIDWELARVAPLVPTIPPTPPAPSQDESMRLPVKAPAADGTGAQAIAVGLGDRRDLGLAAGSRGLLEHAGGTAVELLRESRSWRGGHDHGDVHRRHPQRDAVRGREHTLRLLRQSLARVVLVELSLPGANGRCAWWSGGRRWETPGALGSD